jgi:hypothetical protein
MKKLRGANSETTTRAISRTLKPTALEAAKRALKMKAKKSELTEKKRADEAEKRLESKNKVNEETVPIESHLMLPPSPRCSFSPMVSSYSGISQRIKSETSWPI